MASSITAEMSHGCEVTDQHTRILRVALALDESFSYWQHVRPEVKTGEQARSPSMSAGLVARAWSG